MIRLKDIAARAGVSVMTVSKALRDEPDISVTTKTRLKHLAKEMGYVPDTFARALRTRSSGLLGLVISTITNPIFARVIYGIEEQAREAGYQIVLAQTLGTVEREEACIRQLLARQVDGLFISPVYRMPTDAGVYREIIARKTPAVILGHRAAFCSQFHSVEPDDLQGSYQLTGHLLKLGHKRIAFLTGPIASPASQERFEGYRRALREAGLEADEKLVFQAGTTIEDGVKAALQMLNEANDATAVQADNDLVAVGAANTFLNQGLKIPQDLSVVGFGNILTAEYFRVPLTTVRQPKHRLGSAAMEAMTLLLRGETPQPRRLAADVVIRASSGPPPQKTTP